MEDRSDHDVTTYIPIHGRYLVILCVIFMFCSPSHPPLVPILGIQPKIAYFSLFAVL